MEHSEKIVGNIYTKYRFNKNYHKDIIELHLTNNYHKLVFECYNPNESYLYLHDIEGSLKDIINKEIIFFEIETIHGIGVDELSKHIHHTDNLNDIDRFQITYHTIKTETSTVKLIWLCLLDDMVSGEVDIIKTDFIWNKGY